MNAPQITVVGHLAREPKLRTLAGGAVVADFRIGTTPSRLDKTTGVWNDLPTMWFGVSCWRTLAQYASMSLKTGDRVIVTGRLTMKTWTTEQGEERSGFEIDATSVGMDLSRGPVTQLRATKQGTVVATAPAADEDPAEVDQWAPAPTSDPLTGQVAEDGVAA